MLSTLLPFMLFAFVASITPGPTNILVLSNSARFGFRATLPIILGACAGAALLVLVVNPWCSYPSCKPPCNGSALPG